MCALGMSVDLRQMKTHAVKPLAALVLVSILLSTLNFFAYKKAFSVLL
jgi:uncharacterized membrane protein YadS